jgi:hypothetical protein
VFAENETFSVLNCPAIVNLTGKNVYREEPEGQAATVLEFL